MEVKIGVTDSPRELVVVSAQSPDEVEALVTNALGGAAAGVLSLVDEKGRKFLVQSSRITYVEIGPSDGRKVGFAPTS
ncbi:DUF3107 domain-containing protein [Prescottella subtropica]|uniref:DUF3107 domain-containing protein n=1 Tax=Prescottella subtropica TaxID=2545757 RepID=UPI00147870A5|nr:DUF3107 domain-containing protein [Prescottella subtropica]